VLADVPGLRDFAVIGRADPRWGEVPVAVIVADPAFDEALIAEHFAAKLARFKHPRAVLRLPALPRTALGKLQLEKLRDLLSC
jgi:fatty-acyl-CoA synthase